MATSTIIEQEGPYAILRDEFHGFMFRCSDCGLELECPGGRRQAEDLLDSHDCQDTI